MSTLRLRINCCLKCLTAKAHGNFPYFWNLCALVEQPSQLNGHNVALFCYSRYIDLGYEW